MNKKIATIAMVPALVLSIATASFAQTPDTTVISPTTVAGATKIDLKPLKDAIALDKATLKTDQKALVAAIKTKDAVKISAARAVVTADKTKLKADEKALTEALKANGKAAKDAKIAALKAKKDAMKAKKEDKKEKNTPTKTPSTTTTQ